MDDESYAWSGFITTTCDAEAHSDADTRNALIARSLFTVYCAGYAQIPVSCPKSMLLMPPVQTCETSLDMMGKSA